MKIMSGILMLLLASVAAATTYDLPDARVQVTPNWSNTTTIATINGITYRGPSAFTMTEDACVRANDPRYHCQIGVESGVVLKASDGTMATINLKVQFAAVLITSGHNYWRNSQTVLDGTLLVP